MEGLPLFGLQWNLDCFISFLYHYMVLTPGPHPSTGECLSPPLGGLDGFSESRILGRVPYNGSMSAPILATKLYIPPPRPKIVPRPRLLERLTEGLSSGYKLTLISASAGFGKTTLVSEWVAGCDQKAAWLSLDEGDNDPTRLWRILEMRY
jgi:hypothetical protein